MRREAENWLRQGRADLEAARDSMDSGHHEWCAFQCQQSAEKFLKALYIERLRNEPPRTHSLIEIGRELAVSPEIMAILRALNREYVCSRYPDAANGVPFENYSRDDSERFLNACRQVLTLVEGELGIS